MLICLYDLWIKVWEEGGDDVRSAWPFDALGDTRATMAGTEGCEIARWSQSQKAGPSSDWSLQLDSMKPESLVIGNQPCPGEYVPGSCTHRPSRQESRQHPKVLFQSRDNGGAGDRDEVVTRHP